MAAAIYWLVLIELLGLLVFPIAYRVFSHMPDRGWAFSKPMAVLLMGYGVWLIGLSHTIPNSRWTVLLALAVLTGLSGASAYRQRVEITAFVRREARMLLTAEAVFLAVFFTWVVLRGYISVIDHTEQPMDLMLLNSVVTSPHYPPNDPWLAGEQVSYYYFGYLMAGTLTMLSGLSTAVTFNLALASTAALSAVAIFGVTSNLVRVGRGGLLGSSLAGLVSVFLLLVASNLAGTLELVRAAGAGGEEFWAWIGIDGLGAPNGPSGDWTPAAEGWWWWTASRVIPGTITEFPHFSLILGDMHPHVMSLPFVLLVVALAIQVYRTPGLTSVQGWKDAWPLMVMVPLATGTLAAINLWDLPLGLALMGGAVLLYGVRQLGVPSLFLPAWKKIAGWSLMSIVMFLVFLSVVLRSFEVYTVILIVAIAVVLAIALFLLMGKLYTRLNFIIVLMSVGAIGLFVPFYLSVESASYPWKLEGLVTRPLHLTLIWGMAGVLGLLFLAMQTRKVLKPRGPWGVRFGLSAAFAGAPVVLWIDAGLGALAYEVVLLAVVMHQLGFRWAKIDEVPMAIGSGISRLLLLTLLVVLFLYFGITQGDGGTSAVSRFVVVLPMVAVITLSIYTAWTLARMEPAEIPLGDGVSGPASDNFAVPVLGIFAIVGMLVMGAELFYVVDVFGGALRRMNTVFKLYYQAWTLMAVVGGVSVYTITRGLDRSRLLGRVGFGVWVTGLVLLFGGLSYYPIASSYARASAGSGFELDGQAFLAASNPAEYEAIQWIKDTLPRDAVVVESAVVACPGNPFGCHSFTSAGRIAASTGRPTVLGWEQHELQWRSSPSRLGTRSQDVRDLYQTTDPTRARDLLEAYDIDYVILGSRERLAYGEEGMDKFSEIATPVFRTSDGNGLFTVYRVLP
jgi:YYY domain-containing protein